MSSRAVACRAAAIFVVGAAVAVFCAPRDETQMPLSAPAPPAIGPAAGTASGSQASISDRVQELLAEGGCPGWIALASDAGLQQSLNGGGGTLGGRAPDRGVHASRVEDNAVHGAAFDGSSPLQLVALPPVDPDELIPESQDLLRTSPEVTGRAAESSPEPSVDAAPPAPALEEETAPIQTPAASGADDADAAAEIEAPEAPESLPEPARESLDERELLDERDDLLVPPTAGPPSAVTPTPPAMPGPTTPPNNPGPNANGAPPPAGSPEARRQADAESRCEFVAKALYPSATECRACHEKIYDEWSVSSHAYAFVSPMFHKFEQKINDVASGTIGYFCYRCHTPAGTSLGISRAAPLWELPQVAREGVTCVACHRVREMYGKTNGERRIEPGDIFAPVYGTIGGDGVAQAAARTAELKVHTSPHSKTPGIDMHAAGLCMPQLGRSEFCTSCHQVAVYPGIKLEVVWEQYRASPACKKGIQCQECHMGRIPGVPSGYEFGPAAVINGKNVATNRKHSNHVFYGPGYSIAHPGVFPFNPKADRWDVRTWLLFDWRAGWGTHAFEDAVDDGRIHVDFPQEWKEADDRYDAREIIEANLKKKALKNNLRRQVMENGSHVDGPYFAEPPRAGQDLQFSYVVLNTNEGHNLPTASLGAQPQLWANVVLIGPRGQRLWESGYLDSRGDLADIHSVDVREKRLTFDWQLFNLQTMFLITGAKGTDREFFLPVNIDIDPLPFIRPAGQPVSVINHPPFIRMEARSLAPLGSRRVPYKVPADLLCEPGRYRLTFRMRNRMEPLYFMRFCDATLEMQRAMIEGTLDFHESSVEFEVR